MQNGFVVRFNRTYRDEVLDFYVFSTLREVQEITEGWIAEYNQQRPHESLKDLTPSEYLGMNVPELSTNLLALTSGGLHSQSVIIE
jgi:putative transposase